MLLLAVTHVVIDKAPPSARDLLDWLPLLATTIAAASACLSLASVRQAKKIWEHSLLPVLSSRIVRDGTEWKLSIVNRSKTVAAGAGWAVFWDGRRNDGYVEQGAVAPDEVVPPIRLMDFVEGDDPDASPGPVVIVWCRDVKGDLHFWDTGQQHTHLKRNEAAELTPTKLLTRYREKKSVENAAYTGTDIVTGYI